MASGWSRTIWRATVLVVILLLAVLAYAVRSDIEPEILEARYATAHSRFATLADGTRVHYWDRGAVDAPILVLLHGSYDSADTWERWVPHLEDDFRLIVPDLPAHGLTGKTVADDYRRGTMVRVLHELLQTIGVERAHIAGNSMGGNVGWRYTLAHPEMVERLVLISASGYPQEQGVAPKAGNAFTRWLLRWGYPKPLLARGFREAVGSDDAELISGRRLERLSDYVRRTESRAAHQKRGLQRKIREQPYERISEIRKPTLIIWGAQDPLVPVEHAHRFAHDIPNSKLLVYEGVEHMAHLEAPRRSAADAKAFLLAPAPVGRHEPFSGGSHYAQVLRARLLRP